VSRHIKIFPHGRKKRKRKMHLGQISLCDSIGYNIKSDDDKKRILEELDKTYSVRVIKRHHENFTESRHVDIINNNPYLISVRTNGNPYYLYLTRCSFVNQCILVDKKVQQGYFYPRMILVRLWFDDTLFDNTLFEGEMVRDSRGEWNFIISDLLVHRNVPQNDINLVRRINTVYEILDTSFTPDDLDVCGVQVKKYFPCTEMKYVLHEFVPRLPYTCRGIYFKPFFFKFRDILLNFDDSLIKKIVRTNYKGAGNFLLMSEGNDVIVQQQQQQNQPPPIASDNDNRSENENAQQVSTCSQHGDKEGWMATQKISPSLLHRDNESLATQDRVDGTSTKRRLFWVRHTNMPDVYELFDNQCNIGRGASTSPDLDFQVACVPNIRVSRMLRDIFQTLGVTDAVRMECAYCDKFQKWTPIRRVDDIS
jgi:hypothetical protein